MYLKNGSSDNMHSFALVDLSLTHGAGPELIVKLC